MLLQASVAFAQEISIVTEMGQTVSVNSQNVSIDSLFVNGSTVLTGPAISESGEVAFEAQLHGYSHFPDGQFSGAAFQNSIVVADQRGMKRVAALTDVALTDTNGSVSSYASRMPYLLKFNKAGTLLLRHLFGPLSSSDYAGWGFWTWANGTSRKIFSIDQPSPGDSSAMMGLPSNLQIGEQKTSYPLAFTTDLTGPFCTLNNGFGAYGTGDANTLKLIARQGASAAGASGSYDAMTVRSDDQGNVVMSGVVRTSEGGSLTSNPDCIWYSRSADIARATLLLRDGAIAPGLPSGNIFRKLNPSSVAVINNRQRIAFAAEYGNPTNITGRGIWIMKAPVTGSTVTIEPVILPGQTILDENRNLTIVGLSTINYDYLSSQNRFFLTDGDNEKVLAWVTLSGQGVQQGVNDQALISSERTTTTGTTRQLSLILRAGTALSNAPGLSISQDQLGSSMAVSQAGDVALVVKLVGASSADNDLGLIVIPKGTSGLSRLALRKGDFTPGNQNYIIKSFPEVQYQQDAPAALAINNRGQVVMGASITPLDPSISPNYRTGIFAINTSGNATSIAIDTAPMQLANGNVISAVDQIIFNPRGFNDQGEIAFSGRGTHYSVFRALISETTQSCPAEFDGIAGVTSNDLFAYINSWFRNAYAFQELLHYIGLWLQGC